MVAKRVKIVIKIVYIAVASNVSIIQLVNYLRLHHATVLSLSFVSIITHKMRNVYIFYNQYKYVLVNTLY